MTNSIASSLSMKWDYCMKQSLIYVPWLIHLKSSITQNSHPSKLFSMKYKGDFPFLAHGWRSHSMGFWRHSNGTRSLTHSFTHSIVINLFIQVLLNTLLLPPLLSITFVPSAFYPYVWHILEGTGKAYIFSRHIIEIGFV